AALSLAVGTWALRREENAAWRAAVPWTVVAGLLLGLDMPSVSRSVLESGAAFRAADFMAAGSDLRSWRTMMESRESLFSQDGPTASVSVWRHANGGETLTSDGKPDASNAGVDMPAQLLSAHLPALLRASLPGAASPARSALVIGLASGI